MFNQKLSCPKLPQVIIAMISVAILGVASPGLAQNEQAKPITPAKSDQATADKSAEANSSQPGPDDSKLVRSIYDLTKTTKSAKELTAFLAKCDAALATNLKPANQKYVTSLKGWALNLRGVQRMEVASQLKTIGNSQHATVLKQAMDDFNEAITCDSQRYRSWMSRGIAHAETEDYRKAALDFTNVVKLKTELPAGWFNRAEALYHLQQFEAAINDYDVAISLDSNDAQALTGRGHSRFALGQFKAALADYQTVANLVPENAMVYINLGDACQRLGKWKDALTNFDKSLSLEHTAIGYQRCAWIKATSPIAEIKNAKEAVQLAKRAIQMVGDSAVNLDTLAAAEAAVGNFDNAKATQERVIGLVSGEEDAAENDEAKPYVARLALYVKGESFTENAEVDEQVESTDDQGKSTEDR